MGIREGREEKRLGDEVCVQGGLGRGVGVGRREERDGGTRVVDPASYAIQKSLGAFCLVLSFFSIMSLSMSILILCGHADSAGREASRV